MTAENTERQFFAYHRFRLLFRRTDHRMIHLQECEDVMTDHICGSGGKRCDHRMPVDPAHKARYFQISLAELIAP